MIVEHCLVT